MTGAEFSGVDLDLLADYVGGALDGTPDEAVVAALITEDATWRDAHDRLTAGVTAVTGQLRGLGSVAEPMPADIFARLDAALLDAAPLDTTLPAPADDDHAADGLRLASDDHAADGLRLVHDDHAAGDVRSAGDLHLVRGEGSGGDAGVTDGPRAGRKTSIEDLSSGATLGPAAMEPGSDGAAPDRRLVAVPSGSRSKAARRLRWAAPVGIAAGVLAFAGFAFQQTGGGSAGSSNADSGNSAAEAPAAAGAGQARVADGGEVSLSGGSARIVESGTDYRLATLGQTGSHAMLAPSGGQSEVTQERTFKDVPSPGPIDAGDPLARLRVQEALRACIEAIAAQHGAGEIAPQTVDFARFDGAPALVVEFTAADGSWVWASGPECGAPGVGAATLGSVRVG